MLNKSLKIRVFKNDYLSKPLIYFFTNSIKFLDNKKSFIELKKILRNLEMKMMLEKAYLSKREKFLISIPLLQIFLVLVESLPIVYQSIGSSIAISKHPVSKFFFNRLKYFSYYKILSELITKAIGSYLLILITIICTIFLLYRYYFCCKKLFFLVDVVLLNLFELFIFRVFSILIFDVLVKSFFNDNIYISLISLFLFFIVFKGMYQQFKFICLYINPHYETRTITINYLVNFIDKSYLLEKLLICFVQNYAFLKEYRHFYLERTLHLLIFIANAMIFANSTYLLTCNKYVYFYNNSIAFVKYGICSYIFFSQILLVLIDFENTENVIILLINNFLISLVVTSLVHKVSERKLFKKGNEICLIIYLINTGKKRILQTDIIQKIEKNHRIHCNGQDCQFCSMIFEERKNNAHKTKHRREKDNEYEKITCSLFKCFIKPLAKKRNQKDLYFLTHYYLLQFCCLFLTEEPNYFRINKNFLKIQGLINISKKNNLKNSGRINLTFQENAMLNLVLINYFLKNTILDGEEDKKKYKYYAKIDKIIHKAQLFMKEIDLFLEFNIKSPREITSLAASFAKLKREIDFQFLISKENRFNYQCILCEYALEELYNDKFSSCYNIRELISQYDDLLNSRYDSDCYLICAYEILSNWMMLHQGGKELAEYKGCEFFRIFPSYLRNEGIKKIRQHLNHSRAQPFDHYFYRKSKDTVESIQLNFLPLPIFKGEKMTFIYIVGYYKIHEEKLIILQKYTEKMVRKARLLAYSEKASRLASRITQSDIDLMLKDKFFFGEESLPTLNLWIQSDNINLTLNLIEVIDENYEIYKLGHSKKTYGSSRLLGESKKAIIDSFLNGDYKSHSINFEFCNTGVSSSVASSTRSIFLLREAKHDKPRKKIYAKFFRYIYYIFGTNFIILITICIFLAVELINNKSLNDLFGTIKNYNNFQSTFYHTTLSVFSLSCNADDLYQAYCLNQFTIMSENFAIEHGLPKDVLLNQYIFRELFPKTHLMERAYRDWVKIKESIKWNDKLKIDEDNFKFVLIDEIFGNITTTTQTLKFSEGIQSFIAAVNILSNQEEFLESQIFFITADGRQHYDFENLIIYKTYPNNIYLNEAQRYYYTILINFQRFIQRFLKVGDFLSEGYNNKIAKTKNDIIVFILFFIALHLLITFFVISFVFSFKKLHFTYYTLIYMRLSDPNFIKFFKRKVNYLLDMLEMYKIRPKTLISKIQALKNEEKKRAIKLHSQNSNDRCHSQQPYQVVLKSPESLNEDKVKKNFYNSSFLQYIKKAVYLMAGYFVMCFVIMAFVFSEIDSLFLLNKYSKYTYDMTNFLYLDLSLIQLMALTNQTDHYLYNYFNEGEDVPSVDENGNEIGYVHEKRKYLIKLNKEIEKIEKDYSQFTVLGELFNVDCETFYKTANDEVLSIIKDYYPELDYTMLLSAYCSTFTSFAQYQNEKLSIDVINYLTGRLLDMFVDMSYDTLFLINNCDLLYDVYLDLLLVVRPMRAYLYSYLVNHIITKIISNYTIVIITFIICNFVYDGFILFILKLKFISTIVEKSKEILFVAKAFEC